MTATDRPRMRVWLITIGEPLPTDGPHERLLRTGILANHLAQQGHEVIWWTSSFDHVRKRQRSDMTRRISLSNNYSLCLIHARGYRSNVSLQRILNHRRIGHDFRHMARRDLRPDVILCSWPTLELCVEAVDFGNRFGVPVVLDVRDLWPDAIADLAPAMLRYPARLGLRKSFQYARYAASNATAITGLTQPYVDWGLAYAGRRPSPLDRHFALGYDDKRPSESALRNAQLFWAKHGISQENKQFIACWFGLLGRHFEIEVVIKAARRLETLGKPVRFVLCGDGPELNRLRSIAADCQSVLFPGWMDAAQIWTLLRASSVGLAPYVSSDNFVKNLPNKPVEYLSAGLPIVSSLQGVLARLIDEHQCGITYRNGRPEELVQSLLELHDSARRQRMAARAIALYRAQFRAETVYAEMEKHLASIAEIGQRSSAVAAA